MKKIVEKAQNLDDEEREKLLEYLRRYDCRVKPDEETIEAIRLRVMRKHFGEYI